MRRQIIAKINNIAKNVLYKFASIWSLPPINADGIEATAKGINNFLLK